jgi:hypothetical protein
MQRVHIEELASYTMPLAVGDSVLLKYCHVVQDNYVRETLSLVKSFSAFLTTNRIVCGFDVQLLPFER